MYYNLRDQPKKKIIITKTTECCTKNTLMFDTLISYTYITKYIAKITKKYLNSNAVHALIQLIGLQHFTLFFDKNQGVNVS